MTKKHSAPLSFKQYNLPKTLFISTIAGVLAAISNGVLASCESEVETCKSSCQGGYAELTTSCAQDRSAKYDDCGNIWAQILMTREERDTCRALAYSEYESCVTDAERYRDGCKNGCDDNMESCSS